MILNSQLRSNMSTKNTQRRRKVSPASKNDRSIILDALLKAETNGTSFFDVVSNLDPDVLKRSINQILNANLDLDSLSASAISSASGSVRSIDQFLEETNLVFRFAPAPSGELHIGHVVPIILNILLAQVNRNYGKSSKIVIRLDDTDPDILDNRDVACENLDIIKTLKDLLQTPDLFAFGIEVYRSSDHIDSIVEDVLDSIRDGDDWFYVDITPQDQIKHQRSQKNGSSYRDLDKDAKVILLDKVLDKVNSTGAVIRAKIDPASDNGNLRDPVMIRIRNVNGQLRFYPTYDLVCPVLDLYDSRRFATIDKPSTLLALRDCNYFDRLDQYRWIQNALGDSEFVTGDLDIVVNPTSMLTFSRIQIENALLSKRNIKALIASGVVNGWDDPRLFTIPGMKNRGVSFAGLANFYWIVGAFSTANRSSTVTLENFFANLDKVLSRTVTPIVNRLPSDLVIPDSIDTIYNCRIISYRNILFNSTSESRTNVDDLALIRIDIDQILTSNLTNFKKIGIDPDHLNTPGVNALQVCRKLQEECGSLFLHGTDLKVGQIVKINNFKDLQNETVLGGFYLICNIDSDNKTILFSLISN